MKGERREDRVGVWVRRPDKPPGLDGATAEDKIAAIGIRVRRWVTFHGISLNVEPDLAHFAGIVPCGVAERHLGVTSLVDLGLPIGMAEADAALRSAFEPIFGETTSVHPVAARAVFRWTEPVQGRKPMYRTALAASAMVIAFAAFQTLRSQETDYGKWPPLVNPFESTSGGGVMIDGYKPVVSGTRCTTDFS